MSLRKVLETELNNLHILALRNIALLEEIGETPEDLHIDAKLEREERNRLLAEKLRALNVQNDLT